MDIKNIPANRKFYVIRTASEPTAHFFARRREDGSESICVFAELRDVVNLIETQGFKGTVTIPLQWSEIINSFPRIRTCAGGVIIGSNEGDAFEEFLFADIAVKPEQTDAL